jgi:hypothetical protein
MHVEPRDSLSTYRMAHDFLNKRQKPAAAFDGFGPAGRIWTVLRRLAEFESKNKPVWQAAKPVSTRVKRLATGQSTTTGAPTLTRE